MTAPVPNLVRITSERPTRAQQIKEAVAEAITVYEKHFNSDIDLRSVTIDVKMRQDGQGVRVVLVSFQGEIQFGVHNS